MTPSIEPRSKLAGSLQKNGKKNSTTDADEPRPATPTDVSGYLNSLGGRSGESTEPESPMEESAVAGMLRRQQRDISFIFKAIESLRQEMGSIAELAEEVRIRQDEIPTDRGAFLPEDVQLLTENITRVNRKMGDLESLRFELKVMKSKVKRLEEEKRTATAPKMDPPPPPRQAMRQSTINGKRIEERPKPSSSDHDYSNMQIDPSLTDPAGPPNHHHSNSPISVRKELVQQAQSSQPAADSQSPPVSFPAPPRHFAESARRARAFNHALSQLRSPDGEEDALGLDQNGAYSPRLDSEPEYLGDESPEGGASELDEDEDDGDSYQPRRPGAMARGRHSLPTRMLPPHPRHLNGGGTNGGGSKQKTHHHHQQSKKRRRTASPAPSEVSSILDASHPNYRSIWAPEGPLRNERGLMITRDGRIDGRSLRFEGKGHYKREGPRDAEGYLLRTDGSRDKRSVRIIDAMKKRRADAAAAANTAATAPEAGVGVTSEATATTITGDGTNVVVNGVEEMGDLAGGRSVDGSAAVAGGLEERVGDIPVTSLVDIALEEEERRVDS